MNTDSDLSARSDQALLVQEARAEVTRVAIGYHGRHVPASDIITVPQGCALAHYCCPDGETGGSVRRMREAQIGKEAAALEEMQLLQEVQAEVAATGSARPRYVHTTIGEALHAPTARVRVDGRGMTDEAPAVLTQCALDMTDVVSRLAMQELGIAHMPLVPIAVYTGSWVSRLTQAATPRFMTSQEQLVALMASFSKMQRVPGLTTRDNRLAVLETLKEHLRDAHTTIINALQTARDCAIERLQLDRNAPGIVDVLIEDNAYLDGVAAITGELAAQLYTAAYEMAIASTLRYVPPADDDDGDDTGPETDVWNVTYRHIGASDVIAVDPEYTRVPCNGIVHWDAALQMFTRVGVSGALPQHLHRIVTGTWDGDKDVAQRNDPMPRSVVELAANQADALMRYRFETLCGVADYSAAARRQLASKYGDLNDVDALRSMSRGMAQLVVRWLEYEPDVAEVAHRMQDTHLNETKSVLRAQHMLQDAPDAMDTDDSDAQQQQPADAYVWRGDPDLVVRGDALRFWARAAHANAGGRTPMGTMHCRADEHDTFVIVTQPHPCTPDTTPCTVLPVDANGDIAVALADNGTWANAGKLSVDMAIMLPRIRRAAAICGLDTLPSGRTPSEATHEDYDDIVTRNAADHSRMERALMAGTDMVRGQPLNKRKRSDSDTDASTATYDDTDDGRRARVVQSMREKLTKRRALKRARERE